MRKRGSIAILIYKFIFFKKDKGGMSAAGKAVLAIFIISLAGFLIVAGYFYHKNGHLFGYAISKKGIRPVRADDYVAFSDR
jgi:hypothetical protein